MNDPRQLLELAIEVALEAGALLAERQPYVRDFVGTKSSPTDMVTEVDTASERLIVERILSARSDDGMLAEEGSSREGSSGVRWVIDPVDGTTNFLYGFPAYAVSIAAEADGEAVAGVVYNAATRELFAAAKGHGATLNGAPIRVSAESELSKALVATGFGYSAEWRIRQATVLARLIGGIRDVRRAGSAALDLCSVACGRVDAYYEQGLNPWDHAAGALIAREAGGITEFLEGRAFPKPCIVAGAPGVFAAFRELLVAAVAAR
jgi:myo-inositol-1(or 4)-monophosphatase